MVLSYRLSVYKNGQLTRAPISLSALTLRRLLGAACECNADRIDHILISVDEGRCELSSVDDSLIFLVERIFSA